MDRLQAMKIFERVVEEGGFAAAARAMDMSPPVVTRMVAELEQHLGTRLLQRTTRKLALTDAGDAYLQRVRTILHEIDDAEAAAAANTRDLRGTIRIVAAPVLATNFLAPMVAILIVLVQFAVTRQPAVPFGPYLCLGTALAVVGWDLVWNQTFMQYVLLGATLFWVLMAALVAMGAMLAIWGQIKRWLFA